MKQILLLVLVLFTSISLLKSQNTCTDQLRIAQQSFDDGLLDDIPVLLADCMKLGFTKEEKANAYKLLIQTYLFSDQIDKADEVMLEFLNKFPSYSIAVNDPTEFVNLYNTYRTDPIFKIEFLAGANLSVPWNIQHYSVSDINFYPEEYFANAGFFAEVNYVNSLSADFNYSLGISFSYLRLGFSHEQFDYSLVESTFKNSSVGIPLSVRYIFDLKGIELQAKVGFEPVYLINYIGDFTRTDNVIGRETIGESPSLLDFHNKFDIRPFLGAAVKINLGRDQLLVSTSFKFGTINQLTKEGIMKNTVLFDKFLFIEDNMLLNHGALSLSYIRPIYNPEKIK